MQRLTRQDLLSLEQYSERRAQMRRDVIAHKRNRHIQLGAHVRLLFEDRLTIQYQIQEMLRTERIFEAAGIQEELDAYNPLIPDGDNWKATMLIEYEEVAERRVALERLKGIEDRVYIQIGGGRIYAIADEDMERANDVKTASVHFLRFQLEPALIAALRAGAPLGFGTDHPHYPVSAPAEAGQRQALLADLD
jgi:hypothetical protein